MATSNNDYKNINIYTDQDLLNLLDLNINDLNTNDILNKTTFYIEKFINEDNNDMISFFKETQNRLLKFYSELKKQSNDWLINQNLKQDDDNENRRITDRKNKVQTFNNNHLPMKREALGIGQTHSIPVLQGQLNPNLKNITTRIINIDSKFRQNNIPALKKIDYSSISQPVSESTWSSTHFSLDLSDQLTNTLSIKLSTLQIPFTWYNIDHHYGNNYFNIIINNDIHRIELESGNYSLKVLLAKLNSVNLHGIKFNFNKLKHKLELESCSLGDITVEFYNSNGNNKFNYTLGWLLGFRNKEYKLSNIKKYEAEAVPDISGPKYFLLVVDDYCINRLNKGLVSIQDTENKLSMPKYYKVGNIQHNNNALPQIVKPECSYEENPFGEPHPVNTPFYTQNKPTSITQSQQYSLNEIIKNRKNSPNMKIQSPNTNDILAVIPISVGDSKFGDTVVEHDMGIGGNIRNYFGPVDIERLEIKLLDDNGNILNLNGNDWSFTMISEHLYQY